MVDYVDLNNLWTSQEPLEISSDRYWLRLRVKRDETTKQSYYDILGGMKGKDPHVHYGFDLLGNQIFSQPRNQIQKERKVVESLLRGKLSDETKILKDSSPKINFILSIITEASSGESRVVRFEIASITDDLPPSNLPQ